MPHTEKSDSYRMQFAPDGVHFETQGTTANEKAWNWLTGPEVAEFRTLFPEARVRIVNTRTGKVIGDE